MALLLLVALAGIVVDAASREAYEWSAYRKYLLDGRVIKASLVTLELTLLSMFFAIILGVALGVMRRSQNPILKNFAWLFIWIFRGTPVYVQLSAFHGSNSATFLLVSISPYLRPLLSSGLQFLAYRSMKLHIWQRLSAADC